MLIEISTFRLLRTECSCMIWKTQMTLQQVSLLSIEPQMNHNCKRLRMNKENMIYKIAIGNIKSFVTFLKLMNRNRIMIYWTLFRRKKNT
jgi:hypothetical protein